MVVGEFLKSRVVVLPTLLIISLTVLFFTNANPAYAHPFVTMTVNDTIPKWEIDTISASGTALHLSEGDHILLYWGDGANSTVPASLSWGPVSHIYKASAVGANLINATLVSSSNVLKAQTNTTVTVKPHTTTLNLNNIGDVTAGTGVTAIGNLTDTDANVPLDGKQITFTGSGATGLSPVNTQGIVFNDTSGVFVNSTGILHLHTGAYMTFPPGTVSVTLVLQEMGTDGFQIKVTNNNEVQAVYSGAAAAPDIATFSPPPDTAGIARIDIISLTGPTIGISDIKTSNPGGDPTNIYDVLFSNITPGTYSTLEVFKGSYSAIGLTSSTPTTGLQAQAHFAGDTAYSSSDSNTVNFNTVEASFGVGGSETTGVVTSTARPFTSILCSAQDPDNDRDSLCNSWESGAGIPYVVGTQTFHYPLPGANPNHKDVYVEVTAMNGIWSATYQSAINDVIAAFAKAPLNSAPQSQQRNPDGTNGINLHVAVDDTNIHKTNALNVWTDTDTNQTNDYFSIKSQHFGAISERPSLGGTQTNSPASAPASTTQTITISGLTLSTPPGVGDNTLGKTDGTIAVIQQVNFGSAVTITTPIAAPVQIGQTTTGINWGTPTATISAGAGTASQTMVISIPFTTTGPVTAANVGTISIPITLSTSATITSVVRINNSPSVTDTLLQAKSQAYRYALAVDCIVACNSNNPSGLSEQTGTPKAGNDMLLGIGPESGFAISESNIAGTFMHELGHTLGLQHGGPQYTYSGSTKTLVPDSSQNCKPNYESVMSYSRQFATYLGPNWTLNYSSGTFGPLTETNLSEPAGLVGNPAKLATPPVIVYGYNSGGGVYKGTTASTVNTGQANPGIDWDKSGSATSIGLSLPIQDLGITGCNTATPLSSATSDYNDWTNLNYNFTAPGSFNGITPNPISLPEITLPIVQQQIAQVPLQVQKVTLGQEVKSLESEIADSNTVMKLDEAASDILKSAENDLWNVDMMTLATNQGKTVFNEEADSVNDLSCILHIPISNDSALLDPSFNETTDSSPTLKILPSGVTSSIKQVINQLVIIDDTLASSQLVAANEHLAYLQSHNASPSKIQIVQQDIKKSNKFLQKAQTDFDGGKFHKSILEYRVAWSFATSAIQIN